MDNGFFAALSSIVSFFEATLAGNDYKLARIFTHEDPVAKVHFVLILLASPASLSSLAAGKSTDSRDCSKILSTGTREGSDEYTSTIYVG